MNRRLISILILILILIAPGLPAATVYVSLADFGLGATATNRTVLVSGNSLPRGSSGSVVLNDKRRVATGTNSFFWISNAVEGVYLIQVLAPPALTEFRILVTNTTDVIGANSNLVASANNTYPPDTVAYGAAASDRRYLLRGEAGDLGSGTSGALTNNEIRVVTLQSNLFAAGNTFAFGGVGVTNDGFGQNQLWVDAVYAGTWYSDQLPTQNISIFDGFFAGNWTFPGTHTGNAAGLTNLYPSGLLSTNTGTAGQVFSWLNAGTGYWATASAGSGGIATNVTGIITNPIAGPAVGANSFPPRRGTATYLMSYNGTNWMNGGGATNIYIDASDSVMLSHLTNNQVQGSMKWGYNYLCLEEGWQASGTNLAWSHIRFPRGAKPFIDDVHAMGFKLAIYQELTDVASTWGWGGGGSNTVAFANLLAYWGVDWFHFDSAGYTSENPGYNSAYGAYSENNRKRQVIDFVAALRATNSNIGVTYNLNYSPYEPWVGEVCNQWQLTENGDFPVWWATCLMVDKADLSKGQFRRGHTPMFYNMAKMQCYGDAGSTWNYGTQGRAYSDQTFGNGYYGLPMLTWGCCALWQSEIMTFNNLISWGQILAGAKVGAEMMTNARILQVQGDSLYLPPRKLATNGTVEAWIKELDTGEKALLVFNRGYSTNLTPALLARSNYVDVVVGTNLAATAVSINIPVTSLGFRTNEAAVFTQVLAGTNYTTTSTFTIPCPTNHCTLWIVSATASNTYRGVFVGDGSGLTGTTQNPLGYQDVEVQLPLSSVNFNGIVTPAISPTMMTFNDYQPTGSFFFQDGLYGRSTNNWNIEIPVPNWATNITVWALFHSAFAGTDRWTNKMLLNVYLMNGTRVQYDSISWPTAVPLVDTTVVTTNAVASWFTNVIERPLTNLQQMLVYQIGPGVTNTTLNRYLGGPIHVRYKGYRQ